MRTFAEVLELLEAYRKQGLTYQEIGKVFGIHRATIWKILRNRKEPVSVELRTKLELPVLGSIQLIIPQVNEHVFQAHRALICDCGRAFIPNHPLRIHCFSCSPYRGKS